MNYKKCNNSVVLIRLPQESHNTQPVICPQNLDIHTSQLMRDKSEEYEKGCVSRPKTITAADWGTTVPTVCPHGRMRRCVCAAWQSSGSQTCKPCGVLAKDSLIRSFFRHLGCDSCVLDIRNNTVSPHSTNSAEKTAPWLNIVFSC